MVKKIRNRVKTIKYAGVHPRNKGFGSNRKGSNTKSCCWIQHRCYLAKQGCGKQSIGLNGLSPTKFCKGMKKKFSNTNFIISTHHIQCFKSKKTTTGASTLPHRRRWSWPKSRNNTMFLLLSTSFILISHLL